MSFLQLVSQMTPVRRWLSRKNPFFVCDFYFVLVLVIFLGFAANYVGIYDFIFFEKSFDNDFTWPPRVFDNGFYQDHQRTSDGRRIDYVEFSASLTSSLEEWKLNSAFWKLEKENDFSERPAFAQGMMSMVGQIPVLRQHIKYLQFITTPVADMPAPTACTLFHSSKSVGLVILVKSAVTHSARREAIRKTWAAASAHTMAKNGKESLYQVLFVVGVGGTHTSGTGGADVGVGPTTGFTYQYQADLMEEQATHGDLIQLQFLDTYFNNTAKTIAGLHYLLDKCPILDARNGFVFFSDDDMLLNMKNMEKLLDGIRAERDLQSVPNDVYLGHQFPGSKPQRWRWSKWYISTDEYPFSWYPPYITAAAVLLSKDTAEKFFYASHFVPLFRFDDIYLSIIAHMLQISSQDRSDAIWFDYVPFEGNAELYRDKMIAAHGFHQPEFMISTYQRLIAVS
ncbi:hypothetical protein RvY_05950 [Ramazzottius varieornatus]|uniref:Hexosyltransferase n=1 Tax=Ramazzottius varieornatus TaxID=947166 RepID=A0A1D1UXB5_RAMVA|nr:hypothetical protein RvY_05950 [Ramazzottius varieornatus]